LVLLSLTRGESVNDATLSNFSSLGRVFNIVIVEGILGNSFIKEGLIVLSFDGIDVFIALLIRMELFFEIGVDGFIVGIFIPPSVPIELFFETGVDDDFNVGVIIPLSVPIELFLEIEADGLIVGVFISCSKEVLNSSLFFADNIGVGVRVDVVLIKDASFEDGIFDFLLILSLLLLRDFIDFNSVGVLTLFNNECCLTSSINLLSSFSIFNSLLFIIFSF